MKSKTEILKNQISKLVVEILKEETNAEFYANTAMRHISDLKEMTETLNSFLQAFKSPKDVARDSGQLTNFLIKAKRQFADILKDMDNVTKGSR